MYAGLKKEALNSFMRFNEQLTDEKCLVVDEKRRLTDREALGIARKACKIKSVEGWRKVDRSTR